MIPLCHGSSDERSWFGVAPSGGMRSELSWTDQIDVWPSPMWLPSLFQMSQVSRTLGQ